MSSEVIKYGRAAWEPVPVEETVKALQQDMAFAIRYTCIIVHSNRAEFQMAFNVPRGELVPRNEGRFTDGTTVEMQDIGMPQPNTPISDVAKISQLIVDIAAALKLELVP